MSMFKIDELCGQLIKSGKFNDAIPKFGVELKLALHHGVLTNWEIFGHVGIIARFCNILYNPSDTEAVQKLGDDMIFIALRIPNYVEKA